MSFPQRRLSLRTHEKAMKTMAIISAQITHIKEMPVQLLLKVIPHFRKVALSPILTLLVQHTVCLVGPSPNTMSYLYVAFQALLSYFSQLVSAKCHCHQPNANLGCNKRRIFIQVNSLQTGNTQPQVET